MGGGGGRHASQPFYFLFFAILSFFLPEDFVPLVVGRCLFLTGGAKKAKLGTDLTVQRCWPQASGGSWGDQTAQ